MSSGGAFAGAAPAWLAAVMVGGLVALNAAGIRTGARTQNLLSIAKIVLIAGLTLSGFLLADDRATGAGAGTAPGETSAAGAGSTPGSGSRVPAGLPAALVAVFYAYGGYQNTINLAGDVRGARRALPRGVGIGMLIVTALYVSINTTYVRALGADGVAGSPLVAADLARLALGGTGEAFVSLAIFLSAAGFVNATILHVPRSYLAMAEDRLLPAVLGRLDPRTQAQRTGLVFFAATALVPLLFLGSFERLLGYVMFTDALALAVVASCLFVLRRRGEGASAGSAWSMPGHPWLPALFILVVLSVAAHVLLRQTSLALAGCAVIAAGVPLYFGMRRGLGPA